MLLIVYYFTAGILVSKLIQIGGQNMLVSWLTQIVMLVCWLANKFK